MPLTQEFVDELVNEVINNNLNVVYFTDKDAKMQFSLGYDEMYSWYGKWTEVRKVAEAIFGREIFGEEVNWLDAGCLFVALCNYRADLEAKQGKPFGMEWNDDRDRLLTPVFISDYLSFARRCFNSGLSYPKGVRIPPQIFLERQRDAQVKEAIRIEKDARILYAEMDESDEGNTGIEPSLDEMGTEGCAMISEYYTQKN